MTIGEPSREEHIPNQRDPSSETVTSSTNPSLSSAVLPSRRISLIERSRRTSVGMGSSANANANNNMNHMNHMNHNTNNNTSSVDAVNSANTNVSTNSMVVGRYGGNHSTKLGMRGNRRISVVSSSSVTTNGASTLTTNPNPSSSTSSSTMTSSMTTPSKRMRVSIGMRSTHPHPPGNLSTNQANVIAKSTQQGVETMTGTSIIDELQEGHRKEGEQEIAGKPREGGNRRKSPRVYTFTPANDRRAALDSLKAQQEGKESEMSKMKEC